MLQSRVDSALRSLQIRCRAIVEFKRNTVRISPIGASDSVVATSAVAPMKRHLFQWENPGDIPWQDPKAVAQWLDERLAECGLTISTAIVCLPRTAACLRLIELPTCTDDQIPNLVSMQLEAVLGESFGGIEYDFTLIPDVGNASTKKVLIATIAKPTLQGIQETLRLMGCKVESITLAELSLPLSSNLNSDSFQFFVTKNQQQWEVVVGLGGRAIQVQSAMVKGTHEENVRTLIGLINQLRNALLGTDETNPFATPILLVDIDSEGELNSLSILAKSSGFQLKHCSKADCIVRMVQNRASHSINFASPWRAPDHKLLSLKRWKKNGKVAAGIAVVGLSFGYLFSASRAAELTRIKQKVKQIEERIAILAPKRQSASAIQEWESRTVDWGAELTKLVTHIGNERNLYISRAQFEASSGDTMPTIRLEGLALSANDVLTLNRDLLSEPGMYAVQPQAIEPSVADPEFPAHFRIEVRVLSAEEQSTLNSETGDESHE